MSIEQAIIELAAAIRYAADKGAAMVPFTVSLEHTASASPAALAEAMGGKAMTDAEMDEAVKQLENDAKKPTTAKEAVADAKARAAAAEQSSAGTATAAGNSAASGADTAQAKEEITLGYEKDVLSVLSAFSGKKGRAALTELLGKYNAAKGADIKPADYAAIVADAKKAMA
jgi:hypothetical protein